MWELFTPIRIIFLLFALFVLSRIWLRFRNNVIGVAGLISWSIVWISIIVLIFIPGKADFIAQKLGVAKGTDAFFALAIIILLYSVYRIYIKLDTIEKEITKIVRKNALKDSKSK